MLTLSMINFIMKCITLPKFGCSPTNKWTLKQSLRFVPCKILFHGVKAVFLLC